MFCVSFEANTFYISISDGQLLAKKTKYTVALTYRNLQNQNTHNPYGHGPESKYVRLHFTHQPN